MTTEKAKRSVTIRKEPDSPLNIIDTLKTRLSTNEVVQQTIERYLQTIHRSAPDMSVNEWCLIFDTLTDSWTPDAARTSQMSTEITDAINKDRLDQKWSVDGNKLKNRIDRTSFAARMAIGEINEMFWMANPQENYTEIVKGILDLISIPEKKVRPVRRNRISPERISQTDSSEVAQHVIDAQPASPVEEPAPQQPVPPQPTEKLEETPEPPQVTENPSHQERVEPGNEDASVYGEASRRPGLLRRPRHD